MIKHFKRTIKALTFKTKTVFLIDSFGASLTAILLFLVLKPFNEYFGMPTEILTILCILALILVIYSFTCFAFSGNNSHKLLKIIIVVNLTYCLLTLGLVIFFYNKLTILGITYFFGEILIICGIVYIEIKILTIKSINGNCKIN